MGFIGSYSWIDAVLLDGMDYFSGIFFYFYAIAQKLAISIALIGILINVIKMWFGATTVQKFAVSAIFSFLLFIAGMSLYNILVGTVARTVTLWGANAGGGKHIVKDNLISLMETAEHDLEIATQVADMSPAQAEAFLKSQKRTIAYQKSLGSGKFRSKKSKNNQSSLTEGLTDEQGIEGYVAQVNLYRSAEENIERAQKTMLALNDLLKPTQYKDSNGNLIDTYFLDIMIHDGKGVSTNFLSPSAFLKVAIFSGKMLWHREMDYIIVKQGKAADENNAGWLSIIPDPLVKLGAISFSDIGNILLTGFCVIGIIFCAIFALIQYCMCIFEYAIVTSICIVFVPFLLSGPTKNIAQKLIPVFWGFAIKLLVMTILMFFSLYIYVYLCATNMGESSPVDLTTFAYVFFMVVMSFIVTQNAPQVAKTITTGEPQFSMNEFLHAMATIGTGSAIAMGASKKVASAGVAGARGSVNAIATGRGMVLEAKAASHAAKEKIGAQMDSSDPNFNKHQRKAGHGAAMSVLGGHVKNAGQNILHGFAHGGNNRNSGGGLSNGFNRFNGKDGSNMNINGANYSSFANSKNFDENGRATSYQTFNEYKEKMGTRGTEKGANYADRYTQKHNLNSKTNSMSDKSEPPIKTLPEPNTNALPEPKKALPEPK